jgi:hypothetical protein
MSHDDAEAPDRDDTSDECDFDAVLLAFKV